MTTPNIIQIIKHPQIFGSLSAFASLTSWVGWLAWLKAVLALPMDEGELANRTFMEEEKQKNYENDDADYYGRDQSCLLRDLPEGFKILSYSR